MNGANGEATNTDDLQKSKRDKRQDARISQLARAVQKLSVRSKPKKKAKKNKNKNKNKSQAFSRSPFPGIPSNSYATERPVNHPDPVVVSAVAQMSPFKIPRGIASLMTDAIPSQKFTARAILSFTPVASDESVISVCPSVSADPGASSGVVWQGTRAELTAQTLVATTLATGVALNTFASNTPYSAAVLAGSDYKWRLVSAGFRIRNTTAAVNRSGVLRYLVDTSHTLSDYSDAVTVGGIASLLDSSHKTVRKNMSMEPDIEIVLPGETYVNNKSWFSADTSSLSSESAFWPTHRGAVRQAPPSATYYTWGGIIVILPAMSTAQSYDIELIEHWEVSGSAIETLHTPSASHSVVSETMKTIVQQAHHQHSLTPSMAFKDVVKGVTYAEHHKSALQQAAPLLTAVAML